MSVAETNGHVSNDAFDGGVGQSIVSGEYSCHYVMDSLGNVWLGFWNTIVLYRIEKFTLEYRILSVRCRKRVFDIGGSLGGFFMKIYFSRVEWRCCFL